MPFPYCPSHLTFHYWPIHPHDVPLLTAPHDAPPLTLPNRVYPCDEPSYAAADPFRHALPSRTVPFDAPGRPLPDHATRLALLDSSLPDLASRRTSPDPTPSTSTSPPDPTRPSRLPKPSLPNPLRQAPPPLSGSNLPILFDKPRLSGSYPTHSTRQSWIVSSSPIRRTTPRRASPSTTQPIHTTRLARPSQSTRRTAPRHTTDRAQPRLVQLTRRTCPHDGPRTTIPARPYPHDHASRHSKPYLTK